MTTRPTTFELDIRGLEIVGKERARVTRRGVYTPTKTIGFERRIGWEARRAGVPFYSGPVSIEVIAFFAMPQSWSRTRRTVMSDRPHTQKPDGDNVLKAVLDSLEGVAFENDKSAWRQMIAKRWAQENRLRIQITGQVDVERAA